MLLAWKFVSFSNFVRFRGGATLWLKSGLGPTAPKVLYYSSQGGSHSAFDLTQCMFYAWEWTNWLLGMSSSPCWAMSFGATVRKTKSFWLAGKCLSNGPKQTDGSYLIACCSTNSKSARGPFFHPLFVLQDHWVLYIFVYCH